MRHRRRVIIIPARGSSERLHKKNLVHIHGKPLLSYTIRKSQKWNKFDELYVNSEDDEILRCAEDLGAQTYRRPVALATGAAGVIDVVKEQITSMGLAGETIVGILLTTCPLCSIQDLEDAYQLFVKNGCKCPVVSVTKYEKAPEQAFVINDQGKLVPKFPEAYSLKSQYHQDAYRYNTGIIFSTAGVLMNQVDLIGDNAIPYVMPFERSIDIDYSYHVGLVEILLIHQEEGDLYNANI